MEKEIFIGLVYNTALLLVLSITYNSIFIPYGKNALLKNFLIGIVIGFIGIALMLTPVKIIPGVFFDTRSILISVAAMFFGFIPTIIAVVIICVSRIIIGGDGALMGVLVTISTFAIGYLWHVFRLKIVILKKRYIYLEFYIVGVIVHIAMLLCMFALPREQALSIFRQMWFWVLVLYPVGSLLLSLVLYNELKNHKIRLELVDSKNKFQALYFENENKQALLKTLIDSVPDLIFYKDCNSVYVGCNVAFGKFLGKAENEIVGHTDFDLFSKEKAESFLTEDKKIINYGRPYKNDFLSFYPDGTEVRFETQKTSYCDKNGEVLGVIGISRDITDRKKKEEEILYLTHHDGLTGLYNRTYFDEQLIELNKREHLPLSVIIGDINGLKLFNDAFGHKEGDKLLVEVAKIIMSSVRPEDIVARTGGDEFSILLPLADDKTAQAVVDKIKLACECYSTSADKETYFASISLGYATKTVCEESINKVIKSAENFMYRKKLLEHKSLHSSIIYSIQATLYEKSHETEKHAERLAKLSKKLGGILGLNDKEMDELELLSMLHDIGKIGIDDSILTKSTGLTDDEWHEMKKHSEIGYRIAIAAPELRHISEYILCHHERWDGKGYPQGLSEKEIPILSRIISIVDSYDAMTNDRVYRKAITKEQAIEEILANAGTQFDPEIAKLFVEKVL